MTGISHVEHFPCRGQWRKTLVLKDPYFSLLHLILLQVSVVVMNGSAVTPPGCGDRLLVATDRNADLITTFVDSVQAAGWTALVQFRWMLL